MGAISSEIVHLLKVKLSSQNDQRWLLSNIFGGGGGGGGGENPGPPLPVTVYM